MLHARTLVFGPVRDSVLTSAYLLRGRIVVMAGSCRVARTGIGEGNLLPNIEYLSCMSTNGANNYQVRRQSL